MYKKTILTLSLLIYLPSITRCGLLEDDWKEMKKDFKSAKQICRLGYKAAITLTKVGIGMVAFGAFMKYYVSQLHDTPDGNPPH